MFVIPKTTIPPTTRAHSPEDGAIVPSTRDETEVYWPLDGMFCGGQFSDVVDSQSVRIEYNDGDIEVLDMPNET